MPFIHLLVVLKFTPFNPFILEKFRSITKHGWIILFDRDEIIPLIGMDRCTPISTTEYRIDTDDASFDQDRMEYGEASQTPHFFCS